MNALKRGFLTAPALLLAAGLSVAGEPEYQISSELWIDGELRGTPVLVMRSGVQGSVEIADVREGWRLAFEIEKPQPEEGAGEGALWLHIEIHEKEDGDWDHLADSILGLPKGRTGTLSIVHEGQEEPTPETARLYMTVQVERLAP